MTWRRGAEWHWLAQNGSEWHSPFVPPFTAHELRPSQGRLVVSALIALTAPPLPERATPTKVGLTGPGHEDRTRWIHVAPPGSWAGHNEGPFELTRDHFASIKTTLDAKSTPCSLDYEHASIRPKGPPTPGAGFVQATHVRDDGLWALVEFTAEAWDLVSTGRYRFCSGVFDFTSTDPVTGEPLLCTLDTIALTNRPFIDGQHPIALSKAIPAARVPTSNGAKMKITRKAFDKLLDALGLKEFTPAQLTKALEFLAAGNEDDAAAIVEEVDAAKASKADATKPVIAATAEVAPATAEVAPASADAPAAATATEPPADDAACADLPVDAPVDADAMAMLMEKTGLDNAGLQAALLANVDAIVSLLTGGGEMATSAALTKDLKTQRDDALRELNAYRSAEKAALTKVLTAEVDALVSTRAIAPARKSYWLTRAATMKSLDDFRAATADLRPSDLLQSHASAIAPAPGGGEMIDQVRIPTTHPLYIATARALDATKASPEAKAKALAKLTG